MDEKQNIKLVSTEQQPIKKPLVVPLKIHSALKKIHGIMGYRSLEHITEEILSEWLEAQSLKDPTIHKIIIS